VPAGEGGVPVLDALATRIEARLPATRVLLDTEQLSRAPASAGPSVRLARDAVSDLEAGDAAPWCSGAAREACLRDALARVERVVQRAPDSCEGFALRARARVATGDSAEGMAQLEKAADAVGDRALCLRKLVEIARSAGDARRVESALDKIVTAGCVDETECASSLAWAAAQNEGEGNERKAFVLYKRASERFPDDDALLEHAASLAGRMGLHAESAGDYDRLARKHPNDPRWREAAAAEHDAAMREAVRL
jgi:tetratricopeptide (TPR) repeat protein